MRVLILNAYSAQNRGDGLLVDLALNLVRSALPGAEVCVLAAYPESFRYLDVRVVGSQPTLAGYPRAFMRELQDIDRYDLLLPVGGGYQRAGRPVEAAKYLLAHFPQIWRATQYGERTVFLPQSVGPLRFGIRSLVRSRMRRAASVFLRDDKSMKELDLPSAHRTADMAILDGDLRRSLGCDVYGTPVFSVRYVHGELPRGVLALADALRPFVGYVQSTVGKNDDRRAVAETAPESVLTSDAIQSPDGPRRVVVAVRLHAALMALRAGHYVVHLAYERKGFGAFADLGIDNFVHNVNAFDLETVVEQVRTLLEDREARRRYDEAIGDARRSVAVGYAALVEEVRRAARGGGGTN